MTYYSSACLIDKRRFSFASLLQMNELCNKGYLLFQTSTANALSCTGYEIITETIIPPETFLQLQWLIL
jgi:hypothetical protein